MPDHGASHARETEPQPETSAIARNELEHAVSHLREIFTHTEPKLQIEIDPDLRRVVVKVLNGQSGEVIRQIPAREILEIAKSLGSAQGLLLTKRT
ncbi:MAG TPA: flagellar protein FlaG [Nitrospiraceae bacterium]|nr:flagellar protein FlaG [Nitrospiraceae bacterium]